MKMHQKVYQIIKNYSEDVSSPWVDVDGFPCITKKNIPRNVGMTICEYLNEDDTVGSYSYFIFALNPQREIVSDYIFPNSKADFDFMKTCFETIRGNNNIVLEADHTPIEDRLLQA